MQYKHCSDWQSWTVLLGPEKQSEQQNRSKWSMAMGFFKCVEGIITMFEYRTNMKNGVTQRKSRAEKSWGTSLTLILILGSETLRCFQIYLWFKGVSVLIVNFPQHYCKLQNHATNRMSNNIREWAWTLLTINTWGWWTGVSSGINSTLQCGQRKKLLSTRIIEVLINVS